MATSTWSNGALGTYTSYALACIACKQPLLSLRHRVYIGVLYKGPSHVEMVRIPHCIPGMVCREPTWYLTECLHTPCGPPSRNRVLPHPLWLWGLLPLILWMLQKVDR